MDRLLIFNKIFRRLLLKLRSKQQADIYNASGGASNTSNIHSNNATILNEVLRTGSSACSGVKDGENFAVTQIVVKHIASDHIDLEVRGHKRENLKIRPFDPIPILL